MIDTNWADAFKYPDDKRPMNKTWAPGGYTAKCRECGVSFIGDKRAFMCAPCAYGDNECCIITRDNGEEILKG